MKQKQNSKILKGNKELEFGESGSETIWNYHFHRTVKWNRKTTPVYNIYRTGQYFYFSCLFVNNCDPCGGRFNNLI